MVYILIYIKRFCFAVQVKYSNEDKINYHVEFDGNMLIIKHVSPNTAAFGPIPESREGYPTHYVK